MEDRFYKNVLDHLHDGIYFVDRERRITYWNQGAERLTGYSAAEMVGRYCHDNLLNHVDDKAQPLCLDRCPLAHTMEDGEPREAEVYLHHKQGHRLPVEVRTTPLHDEQGQVLGGIEIFSDNSAKMAIVQERRQLEKLAMLDPLTEVGNRHYAEIQINNIIQENTRYSWPFGLLFIDIDHFKQVNDRFGHAIGDMVLRMTARTMTNSLRTFDQVCRWGGEEFVAIVKNVDREQLSIVAEKVRFFVESSYLTIKDESLNVTVSIGGAIIRADDTMPLLIERADRLMYRAKSAGRNAVALE